MTSYAIPAFLTAIGLVGDAIQGWKLIFKTVEVAILWSITSILNQCSILSRGINWIFSELLTNISNKVNLIIGTVNLLRSKENQIPLLPSNLIDDVTADLDAWEEAFAQTAEEEEAALTKMANDSEKYSDRILRAYEKLGKVGEAVKNKGSGILGLDIALAAANYGMAAPLAEDVRMNVTKMENIRVNAAKRTLDDLEKYTPGYVKSRGGGKRYVGLLGPGLQQYENQGVTEAIQMQNQLEQTKSALEELQKIKDQNLKLDEEYQQKLVDQYEAYTEKLDALQQARAQMLLLASSTMFEDMSSIAKAWGGEQSEVYKAMFAASKAFAIAEASVKIFQGIASAASLGWPMGLVAMAQVVAATASIVSNIQSVQLAFAGPEKRAGGGTVFGGEAYLVGEQGRELFVPSQDGTIVPNSRLGAPMKVTINNYTDATAEVRETNEGGERNLEIIIRRIKNEIGSEIRDGRGNVTRAMESTYRLRRGL
jgi:hypothetical protein